MMAYSQMVLAAEARQADLLRVADESRRGHVAHVETRRLQYRMPRASVASILGLAR